MLADQITEGHRRSLRWRSEPWPRAARAEAHEDAPDKEPHWPLMRTPSESTIPAQGAALAKADGDGPHKEP